MVSKEKNNIWQKMVRQRLMEWQRSNERNSGKKHWKFLLLISSGFDDLSFYKNTSWCCIPHAADAVVSDPECAPRVVTVVKNNVGYTWSILIMKYFQKAHSLIHLMLFLTRLKNVFSTSFHPYSTGYFKPRQKLVLTQPEHNYNNVDKTQN